MCLCEEKIIHHNFLKPNSAKPKDILFTIIKDKEMLQILTIQMLEIVNIWHFCLKNVLDYLLIIKIIILSND